MRRATSLAALALATMVPTTVVHAQTQAPLATAAAVAADTPGKTEGGVSYVQPKDWSVATRGTATIFTAPEGNLALAVVEVGPARNAPEATARAWSAYRGAPAPVLRLTTPATPAPPRSGWDERVGFAYETPRAAKRTASVLALRKGTGWTVVIADGGAALLEPFFRRLPEVVHDGRPEAAADVAAAPARAKAQVAARRERLTYPGEPAVLADLARRYRSPEVGELTTRREGGPTLVRAGSIDAALATRRNADGGMSLVTVGPGAIGVDLEVGGKPGARTLTVQDAQHEYVYTEVK